MAYIYSCTNPRTKRMNAVSYIILIVLLSVTHVTAQDGKLLSKEPLKLSEDVIHKIDSLEPHFKDNLNTVNLYRIIYLSNGLKVVGFMAEPKKQGRYPCIIANRGGRWNFGLWKPFTIAFYLGRMASWGYVAVASQYRGSSDGSEGKDEFGGKDLNDIFNLLPVLENTPVADTSRIGMYGESRGGMMTFLAMKRSCRFKGVAVVAGMSDALDAIRMRPELENTTYRASIPDYDAKRDGALKERSAIYWPDKMCKTTPLLLMHGSGDSRLDANQSIQLVKKLYEFKHPVRFILYEGADHLITQFESDMLSQCRRHFDYYVRDGNPLPKL
jgi:dipeptidyl aminopeptidase/acylaminoacyl peptidase